MSVATAVTATPTELWRQLGNTPVTEDGVYLDAPFLHFPIGTEKEAVWHWFEESFDGFSVAEASGQSGEPGQFEYRTVKLDGVEAFREVEHLRDSEGWRVVSVGWDTVQMERRKRA